MSERTMYAIGASLGVIGSWLLGFIYGYGVGEREGLDSAANEEELVRDQERGLKVARIVRSNGG